MRNGHALDNRGDVGGYGPRRSEPTPEDYDQRSFLPRCNSAWMADIISA